MSIYREDFEVLKHEVFDIDPWNSEGKMESKLCSASELISTLVYDETAAELQ